MAYKFTVEVKVLYSSGDAPPSVILPSVR